MRDEFNLGRTCETTSSNKPTSSAACGGTGDGIGCDVLSLAWVRPVSVARVIARPRQAGRQHEFAKIPAVASVDISDQATVAISAVRPCGYQHDCIARFGDPGFEVGTGWPEVALPSLGGVDAGEPHPTSGGIDSVAIDHCGDGHSLALSSRRYGWRPIQRRRGRCRRGGPRCCGPWWFGRGHRGGCRKRARRCAGTAPSDQQRQHDEHNHRPPDTWVWSTIRLRTPGDHDPSVPDASDTHFQPKFSGVWNSPNIHVG